MTNERKSPAHRLVDSLPDGYLLLSEAAVELGVSEATMRRIVRNNKVRAPSKEIHQGEMKVFLFSQEDLQEIRDSGLVTPELRNRS